MSVVAIADDAAENPPIRRLADWSADRLASLAEEYGTPLYVLDLDRARENYRRMADAFPDAEIFYAAKANTVRPVVRALADEGAGVECASAGELAARLLRARGTPDGAPAVLPRVRGPRLIRIVVVFYRRSRTPFE